MKTVGGIAAGAVYWLMTQVLALGLAGGGHGWDGPAALSLALILFCPLTFARLVKSHLSVKLDAATLIAATLLDGVLFYNMQLQEPGYVAMARDVAPGLVSGWLVLWIGWQVVGLAMFARSIMRKRTFLRNVR